MANNKIVSILSMSLLLVAFLSGCGVGSVDSTTSGTASNAQLVAISVTPTNPTIAKDTSQPFTATGIYSDNTTQDLTASVTWSSSDTNVATISGVAPDTTAAPSNSTRHAYAYGKNAGKTTITATSGSTSGSTTLTVTNVTLVSLTVTPANPSIVKGTTQQFIAMGTFSDNTTQDLTVQVIWSSSNTGIATISTSGLITSIAAGSTTVTATSGSTSGSTALTVTAATATLSWGVPTTNSDGTPLTDLIGYKIYYGTSSKNYTIMIDVGNVTTYAINNLSSGTYFFAVTAYNTQKIESNYSNEVSGTF